MLRVDHTSYHSTLIPLSTSEGYLEFGSPQTHDLDLRSPKRLQVSGLLAERCVGLILNQTTHTWFETPEGSTILADTARYQGVYLGCCGFPGADAGGEWFMNIATILDSGSMDVRTASIIDSLDHGELEQFETEAAYLRVQARLRLGHAPYVESLLNDD